MEFPRRCNFLPFPANEPRDSRTTRAAPNRRLVGIPTVSPPRPRHDGPGGIPAEKPAVGAAAENGVPREWLGWNQLRGGAAERGNRAGARGGAGVSGDTSAAAVFPAVNRAEFGKSGHVLAELP